MASILKNAAPDSALSFHIADGGMTDDDLQKMKNSKIKVLAAFYRPDLQGISSTFATTFRIFQSL